MKVLIKRMLNRFKCEIQTMGGIIKQRMISPKGLYSKPLENDAVSIFQNPSKQYVIPLQNDKKLLVELRDNDVILQDDESYIYFNNAEKSITVNSKNEVNVKAKTLNLEAEVINITSATVVQFTAKSILHETQKIGNKHIHIAPKTPPV